jgi:hypothetical protein
LRTIKIYIFVTIVCLAYGQTDSLYWINKYDRKLIKKSDKELLQLQNEYISSEKSKTTREILFGAKVNINKIQEFKKLGIDVGKLPLELYGRDRDRGTTLNKEALLFARYIYRYFTTDLIAVGTVIDSLPTRDDQFISNSKRVLCQLKEIDFPFNQISMIDLISETTQELFTDNRIFKTMYIFKVTEIIKGSQYYNVANPEIKLYVMSGLDEYTFRNGQNVLMFLTIKDDPTEYWKENYYSVFNKSEEIYNNLNHFIEFDSYYAKESNGKIESGINSMNLYPDSINTISKVAEYMKKLEKINDTPNFYNRSYK